MPYKLKEAGNGLYNVIRISDGFVKTKPIPLDNAKAYIRIAEASEEKKSTVDRGDKRGDKTPYGFTPIRGSARDSKMRSGVQFKPRFTKESIVKEKKEDKKEDEKIEIIESESDIEVVDE